MQSIYLQQDRLCTAAQGEKGPHRRTCAQDLLRLTASWKAIPTTGAVRAFTRPFVLTRPQVPFVLLPSPHSFCSALLRCAAVRVGHPLGPGLRHCCRWNWDCAMPAVPACIACVARAQHPSFCSRMYAGVSWCPVEGLGGGGMGWHGESMFLHVLLLPVRGISAFIQVRTHVQDTACQHMTGLAGPSTLLSISAFI